MKLKIKRISKGLLAAALVLSVAAGCQHNETETITDASQETEAQTVMKDTVIAVSMPSATEGWDYDAVRSAGDYLFSISSDTLGYILFTASSAQEQSDQLDSLVGENIHAAVVYPVDDSQSLQGAANLKNSGVPVVAFNGELSGITPDASVTMDEGVLGRNAAQSIEDADCEGMNVLMFTDEENEQEAERIQRFESALPSGISTISVATGCSDRNEASEALTDWLSGQETDTLANVGAVFASGEESLLGVLEGLASYEAANGTAFPNLKIIAGCGSSDDLLTWLNDNDVYSAQTWFYSSEAINTAIDLAIDITNGSLTEDTVAVEAVSADHSSAGSYMAESDGSGQ